MTRRQLRRAVGVALVAACLAAPSSRADEGSTPPPDVPAPPRLVQVSGDSPFPAEGCGQIDQVFYGTSRGREQDLALTANPADPHHLVAAWVQDEGFGIVTATSFDGGDTWTRSAVPGMTVCNGGKAQRILHARLAFAGGRVFVAGETLDGWFPDPRAGVNGVALAVSGDGGLTWAPSPAPVPTDPAMNGLNHIVGEPGPDGGVVVAWHSPEPVATSYLSRSADGGATWTTVRAPSSPTEGLPFLRLVVGEDGTYYLFNAEGTLQSFAGLPVALSVHRSNDRGKTWGPRVVVWNGPASGWPTGGVTDDGAVVVSWAATAAAGRDLMVSRSTDGGTTWSAPVTAYAGFTGPEPIIAVAGDGRIGAALITAGDGGDVLLLATSDDLGATWATRPLDGPFPAAFYGFYHETVPQPEGFAAVYERGGATTEGGQDAFVALVG